MFGIGLPELVTILILATIFLGPEGMVKFASQAGRWLAKFRRETEGVTKEFKEAFNLELNPQEFRDALDLGIDPKDPLGLNTTASGAKAATPRAARPAGASSAQWNLPASTSGQTSAVPPMSVETTLAEGAATEDSWQEQDDPYNLPAFTSAPEARPSVAREPIAANTSSDAEAVSIGVAEYVPEDDKAEATVIGEPLWVDGAEDSESGDGKGLSSTDSEEVA